MVKFIFLWLIPFLAYSAPKPDLKNDRFEIFLQADHSWIVQEKSSGMRWHFRPDFVVLSATEDPGMAMRPAGIENVMYNVVTWKALKLNEEDRLKEQTIGKEVAGDGFDDRILKGKTDLRTADLFKAGNLTRHTAEKHKKHRDNITFSFRDTEMFTLSATLSFSGEYTFPTLHYTIQVKKESYYAVGYTGAPAYTSEALSELWQPMVWQEKRFPEKSFLTLAFQCPVPSALVCASGGCAGVVADPAEFPFQPLPLLDNSRFGIALRTEDGKAKPMLFAPALGGKESLMKTGAAFSFNMQLYVGRGDVTTAFEAVARDIYEFTDYRKNTSYTLNETLDNMVDYGMSAYSMFVDSLKGCAYSTDVPGAVKNVSSLDPLQMALLTDREDIYWKRAYPIMEFLISREKFLFSLDSTQKIQNPSRKMNGPVAPISELSALYRISGKRSPALLELAKQEYGGSRTRNLSVKERGDSWQNALSLYQATGEKVYLEKAIKGADEYLARRIDVPSENFETVEGGFFFWNGFTPDWINLFQLYEATGKEVYLDAAQKGARQYTMFSWFAPMIPDDSVLVNKGNQAPIYWYLKKKGPVPMSVPEERVPAWQLSEIGLTPESAGTCAGHRAIFMANYAPWMLRIGFLKNDDFLKQTARSAVIGRYANFPGYHINTERTTAYEKEDYPLRPFRELNVNSFHFNHIWPHMSILVDYLLTDAFVKSKGKINMPSAYIEGYAYLQSKFYGYAPGAFYDEQNVFPWMPQALLTTGSKQLNYVAFRGNNSVYLVFLNQSHEQAATEVTLNRSLFPSLNAGTAYAAKVWEDNTLTDAKSVVNGKFQITVKPNSISAVKIEGLNPEVNFRFELPGNKSGVAPGLISLKAGNGKAMVLDFGDGLRTFYLYLQDDDRAVREAQLQYRLEGKEYILNDRHYPFEFTVPLSSDLKEMKFSIQVTRSDGEVVTEDIPLRFGK